MTNEERELLFKQWLEAHKGLVIRVARSYAADPVSQADLLQEIMLELWSSIPSFRGESKPSTWVYRVALNTAMATQRAEKRQRSRHRPLKEIDDTVATAMRDDADAGSRKADELFERIRQLPPSDRSLILLSLDGLTYRQMAQVLGMSESNVGARLSRIRKKLAESMKGVIDGH